MEKPVFRCSELKRIADCSGSKKAASGMPTKSGAQCIVGNEAHKVLENYFKNYHIEGNELDTSGLDDYTAFRVRRYAEKAEEMAEEHGGICSLITESAHEIECESFILTGHIDLLIYCDDGMTIVIDWKFNYLDVPTAGENIQTLGYAVLTACSPVKVALFADGNEEQEDKFTCATYTDKQLKGSAVDYLVTICEAAMKNEASRNPTEDACKYCPAKCSTRCPETVQGATEPSKEMITYASTLPTAKDDVKALFQRACEVAKLADDMKKRIKAAVLEDPEHWEGALELKDAGCTRSVIDVQSAYDSLVRFHEIITPEQFKSVTSVSIGQLEKACKKPLIELGYKAKDCKQAVEDMLGDNLEKKQKAPSLKVVK